MITAIPPGHTSGFPLTGSFLLDRLSFLRYRDPKDGDAAASETADLLGAARLPKGALTKNLGVPIVVACLKVS